MFDNNKGQAIFVGIMVFITVWVTVVAIITPFKDTIITARDVSHLDCDNTSISVGVKSTCIIVDWMFPSFIGIAIGAGLAYITGKKLSNQ